jgi:26S proteasome regulatory subunit N5
LSKKHGQLKAAVQAVVELAMGWLEEIKKNDGLEKWLELVETLRNVTEGKVSILSFLLFYVVSDRSRLQIFLETPRARVTLLLSHYHEELAKSPKATPPSVKEALQTASDLLSDLQVETYSSMDRKEKTEFILEQMRLLIAVARLKDEEVEKEGKDSLSGGEPEWVKVRVGGRKVNEEFLKEKENEVCCPFIPGFRFLVEYIHVIGVETFVLRHANPTCII